MRSSILVFVAILAFAVSSCTYRESGPAGPAGRDGNANVRSYLYTISPNEWIRSNTEPNKWYHEEYTTLVNPDIVDYGAVLFYLRSTSGDNAWTALPLTEYYIDERDLLQITEYQVWHSDNTLSVIWYDSHDLEPLPPDWTCDIKAIIIEDWPYAFNNILQDVDLKDVTKVEKALGIESKKNRKSYPVMNENKLFDEISSLSTEQRNKASDKIDTLSTIEILKLISEEDHNVAPAVADEIENIERAVEIVVEAFRSGGRLFYFGAGTSGRLGVVDASECPPTYGTEPDLVQGVIAGGRDAMFTAQEGAEDLPENGAVEVMNRKMSYPDIVCGIAASGRTPFVKGALEKAREKGCKTIIVSTVSKRKLKELEIKADVMITPMVGPEIITGSTRMKSGTAQKLVLNMITTTAMVRTGKTLGNVMVDLQLTNNKLKERAKRILMELSGIDYQTAKIALEEAGGHVKTALVMQLSGSDLRTAKQLLEESQGFVRKAVEMYMKNSK